jgi:hypothetical protein
VIFTVLFGQEGLGRSTAGNSSTGSIANPRSGDFNAVVGWPFAILHHDQAGGAGVGAGAGVGFSAQVLALEQGLVSVQVLALEQAAQETETEEASVL